MTETRASLRRRVGRALGDLEVLTASAGGDAQTFVDAVRLGVSNNYYRGRLAYVAAAADPANVGLTRRVAANVEATTSITLAPALPGPVSAGDVLELWNERGVGATPDLIHDTLNECIAHVARHAGDCVTVDITDRLSAASPVVPWPEGLDVLDGLEWRDGGGRWRDAPPADLQVRPEGVAVKHATLHRAAGKPLRLRGRAYPKPLLADDDETSVHADWLQAECAARLLLSLAPKRQDAGQSERRYLQLRQQADLKQGLVARRCGRGLGARR